VLHSGESPADTLSHLKNRLDRVNELIKRELSDLVVKDFTFDAKLVTIQEVDVTPDLKQAHVYVGVIGTDSEAHKAVRQLNADARRLQAEIGKRVVMKFTPNLHFKVDTAGPRGDRVMQILDELGMADAPKNSE
jgi:ribosome-binding factor A